jgi:hypothetical protein
MDADSFIMALRRLIPKVIYSDNGTNLMAGKKELAQGIANLNSARVTEEVINRGIDWRKSSSSGYHFGSV